MSEYILVLIWLAVAGFVSTQLKKEKVNICGKTEYRESLLWAIIVMAPIIYWAGTRDFIGDTRNYMKAFEVMPLYFSEISSYMDGIEKDKGFYFFSVLIKVLISSNKTVYFLILAIMQGGILLVFYRKYSWDYVTSIFLFIASTDYISWMYNGIRQFTAVTITLLAFPLALKKKYVSAIAIILIAASFHQSALIVLPFIFICQGKALNRKTVLFIVMTIIAVAGIDKFTGILDTALADTQYGTMVSDWQEIGDDGTNVLRVLVYMIPTILAVLGKKIINRENNPLINYCVNMSVISTGFYLISMVTSGIFIGRIPVYFSLCNYILLPWEVKQLFTKKSIKLVQASMIVAYLLFYYYSMHVMWGMI